MADRYKTIKLADKHKDSLFGRYIQSISYADSAIGGFINGLKEKGLYDNTIINIYGDHFGLAVREKNIINMTEFLGYEYDFDEMMRVPLLIHIPKSNINGKISIAGGQIDFLPTILNLLGIENKKGIMLGQDLINGKDGFVAEQTHMLKGSFIKEDIIFYMSRDGIYKNSRAWDINTRQEISVEQCRIDYERAIEEINQSDYILKNDLLKNYFIDRNASALGGEDSDKNISPGKLIAPSDKKNNNLSKGDLRKALDIKAEKGYKLIELDLEWSEDGVLHLGEMSLSDLTKWMKNHKDIYIITNIKNNNEDALKLISEKYPGRVSQIIPQIIKIDEFILIQGLGYINIILSLYETKYNDEEIMDFLKRYKVFAVTIPEERIGTKLLAWLKEEEIFIYTYTVNDSKKIKELLESGIDGLFIDLT